jgi:hypothetical protein
VKKKNNEELDDSEEKIKIRVKIMMHRQTPPPLVEVVVFIVTLVVQAFINMVVRLQEVTHVWEIRKYAHRTLQGNAMALLAYLFHGGFGAPCKILCFLPWVQIFFPSQHIIIS